MTDLAQMSDTIEICALSATAVLVVVLRRQGWLALALLLAGMAIVIATRAQWRFHDMIREWLVGTGRYADHFQVQVFITTVATPIFLIAALWVGRTQRVALRWASLTTMGLMALLLVEAMSIHSINATLAYPAGRIMTIAWLWTIGALIIALTILFAKQDK